MSQEEIVDSVDTVDSQDTAASAPDTQDHGSYSPDTSASSPAGSPQPQSPWEAFKRLPDFQGADDRTIAARLYTSMEREKAASRALAQYQQVLPYAQEYLSNRREFESWRQSQAQQQQPQAPAAQPQQAEKPKWWNPPQVKDSYKRYLTKDEDGREIIDPNAPIHAREELAEYQQYKADFARKFLEDPEGALGPMIQDMAAKQAQEIVQKQFEQVGNENYVSSIEEQNRDWLFDQETGNVTPEGLLVHKYIEEAREAGIQGPQKRWDYALAMTERELLAKAFDESQSSVQDSLRQHTQQFMAQAQQVRQQPAPQPAPEPAPAKQPDLATQNMQYLRREAARNPSRSAGTASNDPRTPKPKRSFADMLKEEASSKGLI